MSGQRNGSSGQVVSLKTAILLVMVTLIIVISLGVFIGNALVSQETNVVTTAEADFQRIENIAKQNPLNPEAQVALGSQLLIRKRYEEALTVFEKAYSLDREGQATRLTLGLAYREDGQYNKAISILKPLTQQFPFFFLAQYNLALAYQEIGAHNEAIKAYKAALRIKPGAADVYLDMARTYVEMENYNEARKNVQQALRFVPDYKDAIELQKSINTK